ncbi:MAG TPA: radical SAM family heme chaperone HemW [Candidatus Aquilonibacter sp.]|nr:radical SAM family heme chaperone HemW [Candidatus Aquilonibacter sp.]
MPLGIYISVPFCRTKCSYCNFASDVSSRRAFQRYVERVCADLEYADQIVSQTGGQMEHLVDSIYLGGGTPTVLETAQLERIFAAVRRNFDVTPAAEITVECAPATLTPAVLEALLRCGVNRVSLGVQSWADREAAAVGRLHKRVTVLEDIASLRQAGISNINVDLIAGLPHQTSQSWDFSMGETLAVSVPHVSVYMLEVDDDSRLGRELIAGGARYHAHFVPDEEATADFYLAACERLQSAGIAQYEISNFARAGFESRHNLKYWTRQPYLGFGVDAHSMLPATNEKSHDREARCLSHCGNRAVRFSTPDSLELYMAETSPSLTLIDDHAALEESFFLGLRLTRGLDLHQIAAQFGEGAIENLSATIAEFVENGLLVRDDHRICLSAGGRLLSNEVFQRFISLAPAAT